MSGGGGRGGVLLKLDVQSQGGGKGLDAVEQGGGVSWKLVNFYGLYMCIVPYT